MGNKIDTWEDMVKTNFPLSDIKKSSREFEIMKKAAENGDKTAQHNMGIWHEQVANDFETAKKWYKRAADQGHEGAEKAYNDILNK